MEPATFISVVCIASIRCPKCGTEWEEVITPYDANGNVTPKCPHGCGDAFQLLGWRFESMVREA